MIFEGDGGWVILLTQAAILTLCCRNLCFSSSEDSGVRSLGTAAVLTDFNIQPRMIDGGDQCLQFVQIVHGVGCEARRRCAERQPSG